MPYPDAYDRSYGFENFQDSHPTTPLPGDKVDSELDAAGASTAAIVAFLQKFTRSDGQLANGTVGLDQLKSDFVIGFKEPTTWESAVAYSVDDTVFYLSGFYVCTTAHTSGTVFDTGYWTLIVDFGDSATLAENYAIKTDDYANGTDNSAKSWAVGGTGNGQPAGGDAKSWATKTSGEVVSGQGYGAKKYANDASTSATAAASSATSASTSATNASTSATAAASSATSAASSATSASSSASTATTQASAASTSATNAAASAAGAAASAANVGGPNKIINGGMVLDQRNAGASQTLTAGAAVAYTVDRFYASCTGANVTGQQTANISGSQYAYGYKLTGAASVTGMLFGQRIESKNISQSDVSNNVTFQVELADTLLTTVTWTAYYANSTDTFSSKTQIATGTFTVNGTPAIYSATFNAGASAKNGIAIELTVGAQTSGYLWISGFKLESGSVKTPYVEDNYGVLLEKCSRYGVGITNASFSLQPNGTARLRGTLPLPVKPRGAMTMTVTNTPTFYNYSGGAVTYSSLNTTVFAAGVNFGVVDFNITGTATGPYDVQGLNAFLDCEL